MKWRVYILINCTVFTLTLTLHKSHIILSKLVFTLGIALHFYCSLKFESVISCTNFTNK